MLLHPIDWIIIGAYLVLAFSINIYFKNKASNSLTDYFLGGRQLNWFIAGISMVATTFACDTPLAVTELVGHSGISGNWLWWNMLIGGMLTTFFFAKLWRRAEILTEPELIELRYSGKPAAFLRGFKAVYLGIFMNAIIIGWVNVAFMTILRVFFNIPVNHLIYFAAAGMLFTASYSSLSGLIGVAITDAIQFCIAMTGCVILAVIVVSSEKIGGISGLKAKVPEGALNFFPSITHSSSITGTIKGLSLGIGAFMAYSAIQWWASWYPGAEPGGGGYIAQRMMSTKNEKHSVFATLFFQIAHYCIRPWPWILVALCAMVLYPTLPDADKKLGFVLAMRDYLPIGLRGLLLVAFLAAYMSTISTQLNWGASYLTNDVYKRFVKTEDKFKTTEIAQKHYVLVGRISTILIMLLALYAVTLISSISGVWSFIIECGAGLGLVLILRWYWWRINAWSEITATIAPFFAYAFSKYILGWKFPESFFVTVGFTTFAWILITFITKPTEQSKLISFYKKVRPDGAWEPIRAIIGGETQKSQISGLVICWLSSIVMIYSTLFLIGSIIFQYWLQVFYYGLSAMVSFVVLYVFLKRTNIFD